MYLKSIQVNGFKSFANKLLFEFHDGITAIVGPNGSGKSNVADAVRWVLGEQSAKQLRGANMQDVIFSGSEARKPLGFASVEITFDNCDHKLAVDYDEVSVERRVYRSGESEYLINHSVCRLRDVQELFMDTGIGKEGYSIIGQGQIDKILSTKPEDRRELFDEAAGIVKFKKRKSIAEKNLAEAHDNLSRIMDIIGEIEKQIGPLEKQSITAKEYLRLRDILKKLELNNFLLDYSKYDQAKSKLDENITTVNSQLEDTQKASNNAEAEYKRLETTLDDYDTALEEGRNFKTELLLSIEKREGEVNLFEQQLNAIRQNGERIAERITALEAGINEKSAEKDSFTVEKNNNLQKLSQLSEKLKATEAGLEEIATEIKNLSTDIEDSNRGIMSYLSDSADVKSSLQRIETTLENIGVRKAEIAGRLLANRSELESAKKRAEDFASEYEAVSVRIEAANHSLSEMVDELRTADAEGVRQRNLFDGVQQQYLGEKSRLESLRDVAEHYDGYANAVRKIMEVRDKYPGINGVVADLISTDKKYETAVEVALGASIQHIVTEDEKTAKDLIEYLKTGKFGRATFLPIVSVGLRNTTNDERVMKEKGVISDAASIVKYDKKYTKIVEHLLKAFIVVDNIDNALAIARKYDYSLRLVTLSGEQLQPGGSIAGGAFKNTGNLLGRKREIDELELKVTELQKELQSISHAQEDVAEKKRSIREEMDKERENLRLLSIRQAETKVQLEKENQHLRELKDAFETSEAESTELDTKAGEIKTSKKALLNKLEENESSKALLGQKIEQDNARILELKISEGAATENVNKVRLEVASVEQAGDYLDTNINRVSADIDKLRQEIADINDGRNRSETEAEEKLAEIENNKAGVARDRIKIEELDKHIEDLLKKKENLNNEHKSFLDSWAEFGKRITELEKETIRLQNQREKLDEQMNYQISHIWDEYELTVSGAEEYRDENFHAATAKKDIVETKNAIKNLGSVNVNAIEEYKELSERYTLLSGQRDDLKLSEESIRNIISELDEEMRRQFASQFELIRKEFNEVFRDLFGGGKGELELVEDEDMLEAGIRIIAQPPGKKLQNMMQLSGGEKALTAIALLFAIQNLKPSPFCLLDEIEAALDDSNVKRFSSYLKKLTKNSQFIVITHRRGTMAAADILYGITMQEKGVSTLVSVSLIEESLDK